MMITCLPFGRDERVVGDRRRRPPRLFWSGRNSIAKWMPFELAAGDRQVAGLGRAAAEADGVELGQELRRPAGRRRR